MKGLGDAMHLRNHLIAHLEEADSECCKVKEPLVTFVVAGGGFAGRDGHRNQRFREDCTALLPEPDRRRATGRPGPFRPRHPAGVERTVRRLRGTETNAAMLPEKLSTFVFKWISTCSLATEPQSNRTLSSGPPVPLHIPCSNPYGAKKNGAACWQTSVSRCEAGGHLGIRGLRCNTGLAKGWIPSANGAARAS